MSVEGRCLPVLVHPQQPEMHAAWLLGIPDGFFRVCFATRLPQGPS